MNDADPDALPPALFGHCCTVYRGMLERARPVRMDLEDIDPDDHDEERIIVYEGFLTKLFADLSLSVPLYTSVMNALKDMGCVKQLRRGGSSTPSQWELRFEPNTEAFMRQVVGDKPATVTKKDTAIAMLRQQNTDLTKRVADLEKWQRDINSTLVKKLGKEPA